MEQVLLLLLCLMEWGWGVEVTLHLGMENKILDIYFALHSAFINFLPIVIRTEGHCSVAERRRESNVRMRFGIKKK